MMFRLNHCIDHVADKITHRALGALIRRTMIIELQDVL